MKKEHEFGVRYIGNVTGGKEETNIVMVLIYKVLKIIKT